MIDLRLGDCLDVLRSMPDASVDAVVTDPPYGQTNESYDGPIAFDPSLWRECYRVAKPNAALVSFAGSPTYHRIASAIEAGGWKVRQMWGWIYRDGMIVSAWPKEGFDRLAPAMDPICFATKGKVLLNLNREGGQEWTRRPRSCRLSGRSNGNTAAGKGVGHWPKTIAADAVSGFEYFAYRRAQADENPTGHPNQKPVKLLEWLVGKLPPGGVILDPFAGSGTTLVAAAAEGFDAVGIESHEPYYEIARRRITEAVPAAATA